VLSKTNAALLFVFYFVAVLVCYQNGSIILYLVENDLFKLANCLIFYFLIGYFLRNLIIFGNEVVRADRRVLMEVCGVLAISSFFIFVSLRGAINGRIDLLPLVLTNTFEQFSSVFDYFYSVDIRSYEKVLIDPVMYLFNISVNLDHLSFINRIGGLFILLTSFLVGKVFFRSSLLGLLVLFTFGLSRFVQYNLTSIEYGTFSLLFVLLTFYFFLRYLDEREEKFINLGIVCGLIASFFRFELSIILGMPILLYLTLFSDRKHLSFRKLSLLTGLLSLRSATIAGYMSPGGDTFVHGKDIGAESILALIGNVSSVLRNNILGQHDLNLKFGNVSLLTYIALGVAALVLPLGTFRELGKRELNANTAKLFFVSLMYLFMFSFVFLVHIEGLRSGEKYSVNFFILEILIGYGIFYRFLPRLIPKLKETYLSKMGFLGGCLALFAMLSIDHGFFISRPYPFETAQVDQYRILSAINIESQCLLIKYNTNTPVIDFFFPMRMKSIEIKSVGELTAFIKPESCFYLFDSPFYSPKPEVLDAEKVTPVLKRCKKEILYMKEQSYTFLKFRC
jgi:hypothetical protein